MVFLFYFFAVAFLIIGEYLQIMQNLPPSDWIYDDTWLVLTILFLVCFAVGIIIAASCLISYIVPAIPLYIMAKRSGYAKPWLVFVPYGKAYVSFALPLRQYSYLGMFKTYNRTAASWTYISLNFLTPVIAMFISCFGLVGSLFMNFYSIGVCLMHQGEYMDLYTTYGIKKDTALWLSILGIFLPIVHWVMLYIIYMNEPDFGLGRYYNPRPADEDE